MLMIDDNMFKLARMQESLLKVATGDRCYHLDNYIKNITAIDAKAYDDLVNIMKDASKYNQTLEDELIYLDKIKKAYDQLLELQMRFKKICEQYGENSLILSDMSVLNIEYVDNRISAINGYLTNIKNIEINKNELEILNEKLVSEEKKRDFLNKKIFLFEKKLREEFVHASLKQVVFGKLESFDIISEYSKLGYDVVSLLDNPTELDSKYRNINAQSAEISEKYEAAKLCYNNLFNSDSKNIISEIEKEFYLSKYKYIMLKILKLLVNDVDNYDLAKVKRENFIELINNRDVCLKKLGINNPLNIISIVDIDDQLKEISGLSSTVKNIHSIRKKISELSNRTEDMINENNNYLISLNDTKELIISKVSFNDFDITSLDDIIEDEARSKEVILDNQVVEVKSISSSFKLILSKQKAYGVIERICNMNLKKVGPSYQSANANIEVVPELVIGPMEDVVNDSNDDLMVNDTVTEIMEEKLEEDLLTQEPASLLDSVDDELPLESETEEVSEIFLDNSNDINTDVVVHNDAKIDSSIFETTVPFSEPIMFADRTDNVMSAQKEEIKLENAEVILPTLEEELVSDAMPEAFWVVDENIPSNNKEEVVSVSFDDQINALLADSIAESSVKKR